jgi:hypothetical protein
MTRQEAVRYLVSHQRVLETVMDAFPVLPVKFGTVLPDERWVHRLLAQGESLFRTTLEKFADRVQMEVVVLWNLQEIFQEIGQEEPIARLKTQIASLPPDQMATARVAIGQMVYASLERRRTALRDRLLPPLREVALDIVVNPLMDDSMVANVALLVVGDARQGEDSRAEAEEEEHSAPWPDRQPVLWPGTGDRLDQRLEMLDKEFEGRLHFRCVGPLPPYSFATIEVRVPSFDEVDEARRRLGLGETATFAEVRRAYHRLASRLHPDHNHDAQEAESRMAELTRAYRLLTSYAEAVQGGGGAEEQGGGGAERNSPQHPSTPAPPLIFSREAVERTLLIAIRRQEPPAGGG